MLYSVIDIGSNTIRLSIYDWDGAKLKPLINKKEQAGLVSYIDEDKRLSPEGIKRACKALLSFREILENFGIENVFVFATASLRNIENSAEAVEEIQAVSGFTIDLISGRQEAEADFFGATYSSALTSGLLVDIGGGSTEIVSFENGRIEDTVSFPMGSLNSYNRHVSGLFPTEKEERAIVSEALGHLSQIKWLPPHFTADICGVGGSIRGTFKLYNDLFSFKGSSKSITGEELKSLKCVLNADESQRQRFILRTTPDRVHTIIPGMSILSAIVEYCGTRSISLSAYGAREGYLLKKLGQ